MEKKVSVYTLSGSKSRQKIELPEIFNTPYRPDVIKRAVISEQSKRYQAKGVNPLAGKNVAASSWGVGRGAARVPRRHGSHTHHANRGAFVTMAVGGRSAHAPTVEKKLVEKINKKEHRLAWKSALAATMDKELVKQRGHQIEKIKEFPLVVVDDFATINQTKEVVKALEKLGFKEELERTKNPRKKAGIGKLRGRRKRYAKGPLIIITEDSPIQKAASNIPGVEVKTLKRVTVEDLAPGTHAGRLVIWTKSSFEQLRER